jgi:hypothetical protein
MLLLQHKLEIPKDRANNTRQLHLSHIPAHTSSGSRRKGDESRLLACSETFGGPSVRVESFGVGTPDFGGMVDCV